MKKTGFYIIKDKFFEDMPDPYLKGNKAGNRPHYYCFEDTSIGIYWMIPLSSRIDKSMSFSLAFICWFYHITVHLNTATTVKLTLLNIAGRYLNGNCQLFLVKNSYRNTTKRQIANLPQKEV